MSSAALYRKPPRRPRSTHRTRCRSTGRTISAACHMHGRGSITLLRGATRHQSSAGTSRNPRRCWYGFGKPSRRHHMAWRCSVRPERHSGARSCLPLAAPVGWDVRSKSGADTALPQVSGRASQERDACPVGFCRPTLYPLLTNQSLNYFYTQDLHISPCVGRHGKT